MDICESALIGGSCFHQILVVVGIVDVGYTIQILSVQRAAGLVGFAVHIGVVQTGVDAQCQSCDGFCFDEDITQEAVSTSFVRIVQQGVGVGLLSQ